MDVYGILTSNPSAFWPYAGESFSEHLYTNEHHLKITAMHEPQILEMYEPDSWGDMVVAGHTHGGQVTLFGLYAPVTASKYGMRYRTGLRHNRQGIPIIISNGLGTSRHPIRMFAPTDIVIVTLHHTRERR